MANEDTPFEDFAFFFVLVMVSNAAAWPLLYGRALIDDE